MSNDGTDPSVRRRNVLKTIGIGAIAATGAVAPGGTAAADESGDHYHNPVFEPLFPDPTVVESPNGTYYAYGSNMEKNTESQERLVPVVKSDDLVDWEYVGEAMERYPDWRDDDASLWAPYIDRTDGTYHLFYSYSVWGSDQNPGIGLATSKQPAGPFTDHGPVFRESDLGPTNCIDPYIHFDGDTPYMIWGSWNGIYAVELTADRRDYVPGTTVHLAGDKREGAYVIERGEYYYLLYSTGRCCDGLSSDYSVEVGRSKSLTGPYYNQNGTDLRALDSHNSGVAILSGNGRHPGPGHNTAVRDSNGQWWMLYHAYDARDGGNVEGTWRRVLMVDRIEWRGGWPVIAGDGTPSYQSRLPGAGDVGLVDDAVYRIENFESGKVVEVAGGLTTAEANVQQASWTGADWQRWWVEYLGGDEYRMVNENSDMAAEVPPTTSNSVRHNDWWAGPIQKWRLVDAGDGTFRIENRHSGKALDVADAAVEDGADVIQSTWSRARSQKWRLEPLYGGSTPQA